MGTNYLVYKMKLRLVLVVFLKIIILIGTIIVNNEHYFKIKIA